MAGVPFELVDRLATLESSSAARQLLVRREEFEKARQAVEALLQSRRHNLSKDLFQAWRRMIRAGAMPPPVQPDFGVFLSCQEAASHLAAAAALFKSSMSRELESARSHLWQAVRATLPRYLVFTGGGLRDLMGEPGEAVPPGEVEAMAPRTKKSRARERHLLLYLQRVCAKNDTLSEFGPSGWGRVEQGVGGLSLSPEPGIGKRESFLERWTVHGAAAALNADPEIRAELSPRLHPNGRLFEDTFVFTDTGERRMLSPEEIHLLNRCDGQTPAYSLGPEWDTLAMLAEQRMVLWEMEVPALDAHAFEILMSDIGRWREGPVRSRWLERLEPIASLPAQFIEKNKTNGRVEVMDQARERLNALGSTRASSDRSLYSALNPIGEECFRECNFVIGQALVQEVASDAAPWIDLWRDCYAFVAGRVAQALRGLLEKAPLQDGAIPLPAFLRHCASLKMPLTGAGMVAPAHIAFQEVKAIFLDQFKDRPEAEEWEIGTDECHCLRRKFQFERFDEYTYPSADLQLSAESVAAVARGDYQWILAELHPPVALLHHGFYWSCPDRAALSEALICTVKGRPSFHYGFFAADFTAATAVHLIDPMPDLVTFIAPQRGDPQWRQVRPAEAEVFADPANGDVGLRRIDSQEYLGSFARAWVIPLGFHPFQFGREKHLPRLRCGRVIVQRQSWTVSEEDLPAGDYTGVSTDLVLAVERLRAERQWPRHIYIRPTERALRRSGVEGRDKDTKPVFIDLESYLFLEIFHRWLTKAGELEITEMLPDPEHLLWREADGRHTFELRTLIVPRS